jgi:hypothetical protein
MRNHRLRRFWFTRADELKGFDLAIARTETSLLKRLRKKALTFGSAPKFPADPDAKSNLANPQIQTIRCLTYQFSYCKFQVCISFYSPEKN